MEIQIRDLTYTYPGGAQALRGVTLDIASGAQLALLGQNGAGKTTLVKHLNGLLKPTGGSVRIGDWDTREHTIAHLAARVGFVFQNPDDQLFKTRVWDEVAFGPTSLRIEANEITARVGHALELCGLHDHRDAHPYDLMPWQRRWVAIAGVVVMQTPIVVLDEPTLGQDAAGLIRLVELFRYWRTLGTTVLAITHDVDFAVEQFPELLLMAHGEVIGRGDGSILADSARTRSAALDPPQLMRLANALGWQTHPFSEQGFLTALKKELDNPKSRI